MRFANDEKCLSYGTAAAVLLFVVLALVLSLVRAPYTDEALLFSPAFNLITAGHMGTSILDETSAWRDGMSLRNIHRYTYQVMPLHFLMQAAWYKVLGAGLFEMRALSVLWGLVALGSWFVIMHALSQRRALASLTVILLALDGIFLSRASFGRADIISAALGFAALAVYLRARSDRLPLAILGSHALVAAGMFTHPIAMLSGGCLVSLTLYYDWRRLRFRHLALAALPYLVMGSGWGLYILKDPASFAAQFGSNTRGRFLLKTPWSMAAQELGVRYLPVFGLGPNRTPAAFLKMLLLLAFAVGLLGSLCVSGIRRHPGYRALLMMTGVACVGMTVLDGTKQHFYLIHTMPLLTAVLAVWVYWCWTERRFPRWMLAAAVGGFLCLQLSTVAHLVRMDSFHTGYLPVAHSLEPDARAGKLIMADAILAFHLGFTSNIVDDLRLGFYTGKRPDTIVVNDRYAEWFDRIRTREPRVSAYVTRLLENEYRLDYDSGPYRVYRRKAE
jgi:hypothetical protein